MEVSSFTLTISPLFTLEQIQKAFKKAFGYDVSIVKFLVELGAAAAEQAPVSIPTPFFDGTPSGPGRFTYATVYRTSKNDPDWEG